MIFLALFSDKVVGIFDQKYKHSFVLDYLFSLWPFYEKRRYYLFTKECLPI